MCWGLITTVCILLNLHVSFTWQFSRAMSMKQRFAVLSERLSHKGFMLYHLNAFQNGNDCLFVAVLDQIEQGGHTLPGGYTVELLRKASLAWLQPRELEYGAFGEEFSDFITRPTEAWGSHLVLIAVLSVLQSIVHVRLAAEIFSTSGSDMHDLVRPPPVEDTYLSDDAQERGICTLRLGHDPELHYVSVRLKRSRGSSQSQGCSEQTRRKEPQVEGAVVAQPPTLCVV